MRRFRGVLPILVAAATLVGTAGAAAAAPAAAPGGALIRVAHLSPDTEGVDVYLNGSRALGNVGFDTVSDYTSVPAGTMQIELRTTGSPMSESPLLDAEATFQAGKAYTVAGVGLRDELAAAVYDDDLSAPAPGQAKLRALHAAVAAPAVDIVVQGGQTLFSGATFKAATPYSPLAPGVYTISVRDSESGDELFPPTSVDVGAGVVYTLAAIGGDRSNFRILPVVDARGSAQMPAAGGVATGAGGLADDGGASPVVPLALAGVVLGAVAAGAAWRRRAVTLAR